MSTTPRFGFMLDALPVRGKLEGLGGGVLNMKRRRAIMTMKCERAWSQGRPTTCSGAPRAWLRR